MCKKTNFYNENAKMKHFFLFIMGIILFALAIWKMNDIADRNYIEIKFTLTKIENLY